MRPLVVAALLAPLPLHPPPRPSPPPSHLAPPRSHPLPPACPLNCPARTSLPPPLSPCLVVRTLRLSPPRPSCRRCPVYPPPPTSHTRSPPRHALTLLLPPARRSPTHPTSTCPLAAACKLVIERGQGAVHTLRAPPTQRAVLELPARSAAAPSVSTARVPAHAPVARQVRHRTIGGQRALTSAAARVCGAPDPHWSLPAIAARCGGAPPRKAGAFRARSRCTGGCPGWRSLACARREDVAPLPYARAEAAFRRARCAG